jgi:hypothetical protein
LKANSPENLQASHEKFSGLEEIFLAESWPCVRARSRASFRRPPVIKCAVCGAFV